MQKFSIKAGVKLSIAAVALAAGFAALSLPGRMGTAGLMHEKDRLENAFAEKQQAHNVLVVGHSWAEGAFRKGKEEIEREMRLFRGLGVKLHVASRVGASIGDTRWQLDENFSDSVNSIVVFTGRNNWQKEDSEIVADFYELFAALAKKGRPVMVFNSQKVPAGTKDEGIINRKVELMNATIEALCKKHGFAMLDMRSVNVGEMADPYHPKSYDAVRRLFAEELENWLSPFALPFSECKADVLSAGAAKTPSLQAPSKAKEG